MTADITRINTTAEAKLIEQFKAAHGSIPGVTDGGRSRAFQNFVRSGLPHRRIEAWHYTDLRSVMRDAFAPTTAPSEATIARAKAFLGAGAAPAGFRFVLLDGHYVAALSSTRDVEGVSVRSLLDVLGEGPSAVADRLALGALEESESVLALNAAFMQGGAVVSIAPGAKPEQPIELVLIASGEAAGAVTTRSLLHAGPHSTAVVIERHETLGAAPTQDNHALIVVVDDGATLDHVVLKRGVTGMEQSVATLVGTLGADAKFMSFALVTGSGFVRRQGFLRFDGTHSQGNLRGVALLDKRGHADTTLVVTHKATHCESREVYKHILDGESTGVFQGKVIVAPGAQKTDGKMMSRAIFLADGCNMYNKPELEIFADDVVCGHGATAGFLNEEQLFYLRARGIPEKEAQALLLEAFAAEAIEDVGTEAIRVDLTESVGRWLRQRQN